MTTYYAHKEYIYDNGDTIFSIPFSYIKPEHIVVLINGEDTKNYTYLNTTQIRVTETLNKGDKITIARTTPIDSRMVIFSDTSILDKDVLNLAQTQTFNAVQEIYDNNEVFKIETNDNLAVNKQELENIIENNKQEILGIQSSFENEVNIKIEKVSSAAEKINKLEKSVNTAVTAANTASEKADSAANEAAKAKTEVDNAKVEVIKATKQANIAASKANEATEIVENSLANIESKTQEEINKIKQTGFYMQDDKLYYIDSKGETKEFKSGSMPIGTLFPMLCSSSYVPDGALPIDGTEYTKALFPNFYTNFLVAGLLNTCTYDEYASDITTYGQCGKFALDTENEKFKVPTIKDGSYLTQALSNTELGKVYNESLPNIQGGVNGAIIGNYGTISGTAVTFTGALKGVSTYSGTISGGNNHFQAITDLSLDASESSPTYQNNAKVQGDNVRVRYFVQVANGQINQSDMDWSAFASALQGKLNKDHSNDEKPYITETYVNGTSGYRLYSDGYCEQWGRISNNYQGTVTFIKPYKDTNYVLLLSKSDRNENNNGAAWTGLDTNLTNYRTTTQFCYINNQTPNSEWFASGYIA